MANHGWISDFKVSIETSLDKNPSVYHLEFQKPTLKIKEDFLPVLRINFVKLGYNSVLFGEKTFTLTIGPLKH